MEQTKLSTDASSSEGMEILTFPDPRLAVKCTEVTAFDEELCRLARDMTETMYANSGVGLAAPQVGVNRRFIVVDVSGPSVRENLIHIANPRIVQREGECESEEGCLSVPNLSALVPRSESIVVEGLDLHGKSLRIEAEGLLAICLQHELDHLDGILILDRISRLKRTLYERKARKWQKQKSADSE